jgi:hypothetical protein
VSESVAVWVREPEVPVRVRVGLADGAVAAAVSVMVADGCEGVRVRVDGLAVTPEGSPVMDTETEPPKEFIEVAATVMALLVVPALRETEPGETARAKSGVGVGLELPPHIVRSASAASAVMDPIALASLRMSRGASAPLTVSQRQ